MESFDVVEVENSSQPSATSNTPALSHSESAMSLDLDTPLEVIDHDKEVKELRKTIKSLEKTNKDNLKLIEILKQENSSLKKKHSSVVDDLKKFEKIFTKEQIDMITERIQRPRVWSDAAIKNGIEIRFFVKATAYKFLRSKGFPFPCESSLTERLD